MKTHTSNHPLKVLVLLLVAALLVATLLPPKTAQAIGSAAPVYAKAPLKIYENSLASGWQDWSWNASRNFSNTSPVQGGSASIAVTITQAWGALYLKSLSGTSTSGYTHLEFYIHGGTTGGQRLKIVANHNTSKEYAVTPSANQWTKVSIPLTYFGSPATINELFWQDAAGKAQAKFFVDTLSLVDLSTAPAPTATKPPPTATSVAPTPTRVAPTPTPGSTRYFTTLPPGSALPSDAECAAAIKRRAENKRMNITFNATRGNQSLSSTFFSSANDPRANTQIAARVTGNFTGTTDEILQWVACKWGIDEDMVRAQAAIESWWRQDTKGDWGTDPSRCPPGHGLGVDGRPGQCPESWGILQNRYPYEQSAWPGMKTSTAFNADTAYGIWRACYEGYEWWLNHVERGWDYGPGDAWGCMGRWFSGRWHTPAAEDYISRVRGYLNQRIWETASFQEP